MKTRILSFMLMLCMLCASIPTNIFASSQISFAGGSGTESDPYLIETAIHLDNVRYNLNAHYKMVADIVFTDADFSDGGIFYNSGSGFLPIGSSYSNPFRGTFDGNGYSISNIYINFSQTNDKVYAGLFGYNCGVVKRLKIASGSISVQAIAPTSMSCTAYVGAIAGYNHSSGTIISCSNSCSIYASSSVSTSYATPSTNAGGIVGVNESGIIFYCQNFGDISADARKHDDAGGIAGHNASGNIFNCSNIGAVSGDYAGGIAGGNSDNAQIVNCYNSGTIQAHSSSTDQAGGIVGFNGYSGDVITDSNLPCAITHCYNSGNVNASDTAGGIVGSHENGLVENCYNVGQVTSGVSGGIAGKNIDYISRCYNTAKISGKCAGGIAGSNGLGAEIFNVYNTGSVSGSVTARTGGIVGYNEMQCIVSLCYNTGVLSGTNAGGIAGYNSDLGGKITHSYYLNNISAGIGSGSGDTTKCTVDEMMLPETYINFDFDNIWEMPYGAYNHPVLKHVSNCFHDLHYAEYHPSTCTTPGNIAYWSCSKCNAIFNETGSLTITQQDAVLPLLGHDMIIVPAIPASCVSSGLTENSYCSRCDYAIPGTVIPAEGHHYESLDVPPSCVEAGYTQHTCIICGHTYSDNSVCATGHTWDDGTKTISPTCTEDGLLVFSCLSCNDNREEIIPQTGHSYQSIVTPPTCTESGIDFKECIRCGTQDITRETDALGHSWDEGAVTLAATCTANGKMKYTCAVCGTTSEETIAATGHSYADTITRPTCTTTGYTTHTCSGCGDSHKDAYVGATGHAWNDGIVMEKPTCTQKGEKVFTCGNCGETRSEEIAPSGHSYNAVVTAPTCAEGGYTTYTCSVCGDSYIADEVNALGHTEIIDAAVAPTCTATGLTEGKHCSVCNEVLIAQEVVDALGHAEIIDVAVAPTCTGSGLTEGKHCDVCGEILVAQEAVDALGHTEIIDAAVAPTCTESGLTEGKHCSVCGEILVAQEAIAALGHNYDCAAVAPTCTEAGYTIYSCSVCGYGYTEEGEAAYGHEYSAGVCVNCGEEDPNYLPENPFVDVKEADYFFTPVLWAVQHRITTGTSATTFSPNDPCTRGQIVTFLWRACGSPEPASNSNPFTDVKTGDYYYKAVIWAVEQGITTGISATKFGPNEACTRGQVATFLWRSQGKPAPTGSNNPFKDVSSSDYYYEAVLWAVENNITQGTGAGKFSPNDSCTRGQIVTFLYRALA